MYIDARYLEPPNAQDIEGLFTCENNTTLSNLSQFCSIIMNSFKNDETSKKLTKKAKKGNKKETKSHDHQIIIKNKTRKATHPARESKDTKSKAQRDRRQENQQLQEKQKN